MRGAFQLSRVQWLQLFGIALILAALGFSRQTLLVNINHQLNFLYYEKDVSYVDELVAFIKDYSYATLMWAKWFLTIAYTLLYLACTLAAMYILGISKERIKLTIGLFVGTVLISMILYGGLSLFGEPYIGFRLARFCMGLVQSPIPLMVLLPAFMFIEQK